MKILHVMQTLDIERGGGVTARNLKLIQYLENNNSENYILSLKDKNNPSKKSYLSEKRIFDLNYFNDRYPIPFINIIKFARVIKKVDIVHLTSFWTILNAYTYIFCKLFSKKYIVSPAGAIKIINRSKLIKRIYYDLIGSRIINDASAIISITKKEEKDFLEKKIPHNKIFNIPNGIDINNDKEDNRFKQKNIDISSLKPYILFVGRLNYIKGPDILLNAFKLIANQIPKHNLVFAGNDDGMGKELKYIANNSLCLDRIHFLGFIRANLKNKLYKNADFLVIPSRSEAMSLVVLEAGIQGTESIFTNECGLEIISEKKLGVCVPAEALELANAIENKINKKSSKLINYDLIDFVTNNFNWNKISLDFLKVLEIVIRNEY